MAYSVLSNPLTTQTKAIFKAQPLSPNSQSLFHNLSFSPSDNSCYTTLSFFRKPQRTQCIRISALAQTRQKLSSPSPPSSREEAVSQAKTSLTESLRKPLNNYLPQIPTRKLKKQRQPRFRAEIPIVDDSTESLTQLAVDVFADMSIARKGPKITVIIIWPDYSFATSANQIFSSVKKSANSVVNSDLVSVTTETLSSADVLVFMAPFTSQLEDVKGLTEAFGPKPVVLFNPRWSYEEEEEFSSTAGLKNFAASFDVVYSFMGLEVKGILSKRRGVVFRCARDGVVSGGEGWAVMVEEDDRRGGGQTEMKVVSKFKKRPTVGEVENLLYNYMAANSPVTKSVKFLKELASNVTGKKVKQ